VGGEAQQFVEQELHRIAARLVQVGLRALLTVRRLFFFF
jgi:ribosome assembly protein YihI (activator of Der GTPase)